MVVDYSPYGIVSIGAHNALALMALGYYVRGFTGSHVSASVPLHFLEV